jgi:hypothetical protein
MLQSALMLLVELEPEVLFEQRREPEGADAEQLRRDARVEEIRHPPSVILMQQTQIVISVVQHHFHGAIFEQRAEQRGRADRQRIDHRFMMRRGKLQQVDAIDEAVKTRPLRVEREGAHAGETGEEAIDGVGRIEIEWCGRQWHVSL